MVKTHINLSVESETYNKFLMKEGKGNISRLFNEFMERSLNINKTIISAQDEELLNIELEKTKKEYNTVTSKLIDLEKQKEIIKEEVQEHKIKELQVKKEIEDNAIKCIKCKEITFENRRKKMRHGFMCRFCFDTMTIEDLKEYA